MTQENLESNFSIDDLVNKIEEKRLTTIIETTSNQAKIDSSSGEKLIKKLATLKKIHGT